MTVPLVTVQREVTLMAEVVNIPLSKTIVGRTPLVRLQRIPGDTSNVILGKLEGNNPAGSVKDRPAMSMIREAESRGAIQPGDTLIEATSGNTGIALAMAAAVKGYRLKLIMPSNQSEERKGSMRAYGAELINVTPEEGMEGARDLALAMASRMRGSCSTSLPILIIQAGIMRRLGRKFGSKPGEGNPLHLLYGDHWHDHGGVSVSQIAKPGQFR